LSKGIKKLKKNIVTVLLLIFLCYLGYNYRYYLSDGFNYLSDRISGKTTTKAIPLLSAVERTKVNYGAKVDKIAKEFNISPEYLKALIVLECSGKKNPKQRFEVHIFERLKQVRDGDRKKYENITAETLKGASDEALKNLATSWGEFQLMGYKCVQLDISISEIRGRKSLYYGVKWITSEYGHLLKKKRYKDAFHYHNTGRKHPIVGRARTHNPKYVELGLAYMKQF
jgi:hypothetical protein